MTLTLENVSPLLDSYLALLGADRTVVKPPATAPSSEQLGEEQVKVLLQDMLRFVGMEVDTP